MVTGNTGRRIAKSGRGHVCPGFRGAFPIKIAFIGLVHKGYGMAALPCNAEHELLSRGKAGKTRWLGWRSKVRGVAMNPVDHPLGGGEGKSSGGRPPTSPWGKPEGKKTRHKKKASTKLIVRGRKRGKATQ